MLCEWCQFGAIWCCFYLVEHTVVRFDWWPITVEQNVLSVVVLHMLVLLLPPYICLLNKLVLCFMVQGFWVLSILYFPTLSVKFQDATHGWEWLTSVVKNRVATSFYMTAVLVFFLVWIPFTVSYTVFQKCGYLDSSVNLFEMSVFKSDLVPCVVMSCQDCHSIYET
jgi:hypothetical protein